MKKIIFIIAMLVCPNLFAATLTTNTVPYVCQGGTSPQLCNSKMTTDSNGNLLSGPNFVPNNIQVFTSNGTWTKPAGCSYAYVKLWGGGGGSDNGTKASGGGEYTEAMCAVSGNETVTIGAGGQGVGNGTPPPAGGVTSFTCTNVTLSANGGTGDGAGGSGGTNTGGFSLPGFSGTAGGQAGMPSGGASYGLGGSSHQGSGNNGFAIIYC